MLMAAETLGLGSCLNGFLTYSAARSREIRDAMGVPEGHKLYAAAAFGYPDVKYRRAVDRFKPDMKWL
jgi:nitroreductase